MRLLVGLGNPDAEYAKTRHNVGDQAVVAWCRDRGIDAPSRRNSGVLGLSDWNITLFRPTVAAPKIYMNVLGPHVARRMQELGIAPADVLVVCDDLNLPVGQLRLRGEGSSGGHHGLDSVIAALGTTAFPRLRIGIGAPPVGLMGADFVLQAFAPSERAVMQDAIARAAHAVEVWRLEGLAAAMHQCNRTHVEGA